LEEISARKEEEIAARKKAKAEREA